MTQEINQLPRQLLENLDQREAIAFTANRYDGVLQTRDGQPAHLESASHLKALEECRQAEGAESMTMTALALDEDFIAEATTHLPEADAVASELRSRLEKEGKIYVVYAVTHWNPAGKPLGPMTVNVGGDCHRTGKSIKDLASILGRTKDLAEAMLRKSVMVFPDVPGMHGGKKGEWIVLDRDGSKVDGLGEDAIAALGSIIIPRGIAFINRLKEKEARELGICETFPERFYARPDSASPDVLSGVYWRGDRPGRYSLCDLWSARGIDLHQVTCLPAHLGGTLDATARPTGWGVATTSTELARRYFARHGRDLADLRFLLEAAGGVGMNATEAMVEKLGIPAANITIFDRAEGACRWVGDRFPVRTITASHADFYQQELPQMVAAGEKFDVWVNNGEGDNTRPEHIDRLLGAGVRVFAGGANNFLQVDSQEESLDRVFEAGGWAWPDPATSGGGWALAVVDLMVRSQGRRSDSEELRDAILEVIQKRNRQLVTDVLASLPEHPPGRAVWQGIEEIIEERVTKTLALDLGPREIFELSDTRNWNLSKELGGLG